MVLSRITTSPLAARARNLGRRIGLNRLVSRLTKSKGYEERFGGELLKLVSAGDCVWDVGANVGYYATQFAEKTGKGPVVAFEPVGSCYQELVRRCGDGDRVIAVEAALGSADGAAPMEVADDPFSTTNRLRPGADADSRGPLVRVRRADSFAAEHPDLFPNVIKVDVEGHEGAVLDGMRALLVDKRLRCVGFEVHFGILQERGEGGRPREIQQAMEAEGFQVRWTDMSHMIGVRVTHGI